MKTIKIICLTFIILTIFPNYQANTENINLRKLQAWIEIDKNEILQNEPIFINFYIKNIGEECIAISHWIEMINYLDLKVYDNKGKKLNYKGIIIEIPALTIQDFFLLCPDMFYGKIININGKKEGFEIKEKGEYTISGIYKNHDKKMLLNRINKGEIKDKPDLYNIDEIWEGDIKLNEIKIIIK